MLDISIKELNKVISSLKKASDFIRKHVTVIEKIDGTKLTLVRNEEVFDAKDYRKNWIVAYKGFIIYPSEFQRLEKRDEEIKKSSLGTSQYKFVHDHLKKVHPDTGSIPPGTEFFIEFVQNKPTITRDYAKKHGMYLVGFGPTQYVESNGQLSTSSTFVDDSVKLEDYRDILQLGGFPVIFEGNFSSPEEILAGCKDSSLLSSFESVIPTIDFSNPINIVSRISEVFSNLESSLGGKAEGVVIQVGNDDISEKQLFKILSAGQHSKEVRGEKKSRSKGTEEEEKRYWDDINHVVDDLLDDLVKGSPEDMLEQLSTKVYSNRDIPVSHPIKSLINKQEDVMLTAKLRLLGTGSHRASKVAVIPIAAKPFHKGHDELIKQAIADGNESVIVFVSTGGREGINSSDMLPLWKNNYLPGISDTYGDKIIVRFSESPMRDASLIASDLAKRNQAIVSLYGDPVDAEERVKSIIDKMPNLEGRIVARNISRSRTNDISGTQMRQYLSDGNDKLFKENLPDWLSPESRAQIWSKLSSKFDDRLRKENLIRNYVKSIFII